MLTELQKTNARRFMGYPMKGDQPSQMFGYRFMTQYGAMEYRLLHLSAEEETIVIQHLTDCAALETAVVTSTENLDTNRAAVWEHNPNETADRNNLYRWKRLELCRFIGVPPGPGLAQNRGEIVI